MHDFLHIVKGLIDAGILYLIVKYSYRGIKKLFGKKKVEA